MDYVESFEISEGTKYTGFLDSKKKKCGQGIQTWPDSTTYEGAWYNNCAHGHGKLSTPNGDVYEGEWKDDLANGQGVFITADGSKKY